MQSIYFFGAVSIVPSEWHDKRQQAIGLWAAQHTLCPETATTGRMGVTDTILLIFRKKLTVSTIKAGGKLKIIKLSPEDLIFLTVPDFCQS